MTHYALYTLLTTASIALATALLGIAVARTMDRSHKFLSFFIALGAGLLVGVALTEFLPQVFHSHPTPLHDAQIHSNEHSHDPFGFGILPALLILLGVFFVIILEKKVAQTLELSTLGSTTTESHGHEFCVHSHSHTHEPHITLKTACLSVGCVTVCSFFDGLEISTAFHMGSQVGWLTSLGFLLHSISNGALAASLGLAGGLSKSRAIQVSIVIGALLFIGSVVGVVGISLFDFKSYVLPFSTGVMLYISFTHLIPLALKDRLGWVGFILGTLITFIIHSLHTH
ncbi:MAG: hypothetical protein M9899_11045 [Bdellovibrionaceae bacterium]|nr:hypothetical protein [Pseudobdellovibrionaceae bacterium]